MSFLFECPFLILAVGAVLIAAFGYVYINMRQKGALIGLFVVMALTVLCLGVERLVQTPREQVEDSLYGLADELEANNLEGALEYLDPANEESRQRARWAMSRFKVTKAKVSNLEVTVNQLMNPPAAEAKFTGVIGIVDKKREYPAHQYPVKFTVQFRQHGDRWIVTEHIDSAMGIQ